MPPWLGAGIGVVGVLLGVLMLFLPCPPDAGADHPCRSAQGQLMGLVFVLAGGVAALWYGYRTVRG